MKRSAEDPTTKRGEESEVYATTADTILPLPQRAMGTLQDMGGIMRLSPLCHETLQRDIRGWVLDIPGDTHGSTLPVSHCLFHGVTLAECDAGESEVLELMRDRSGTRARLAKAVEGLMDKCKAETQRATWKRCRPRDVPMSMYAAHVDKDGHVSFYPAGPPIIDGEAWQPELSPDGFVGFYFRWHEGRLRLYVACQSYLPKACLEFFALVHSAIEDEGCKASTICLSAEAQWLRSACRRNRERIIAEVCASVGVRVPTVLDCYAAGRVPIAVSVTETLHHDMISAGADVRILNYCAEARTAMRGSICTMSPWEGLWIFRGGRDGEFGMPQGTASVVLPTASPRVKKRAPGHLSFASADPQQCEALCVWGEKPKHLTLTLDPDPIFSLPLLAHEHELQTPEMKEGFERALRKCMQNLTVSVPNVTGAAQQQQLHHYLEFDEQVLERMTRLGWNRAYGIIKLIPLGCALFEHYSAAVNIK